MKELKRFISVIFFLVGSFMSFGQVTSPEVKCLAVDAVVMLLLLGFQLPIRQVFLLSIEFMQTMEEVLFR